MSDLPPDRLEAFVASLRPALSLEVLLDQGTMLRLRAAMDRVEGSQPGLSYPPGEPDEESVRIQLMAALDRGLTESERDDGVRYDFTGGKLVPFTNREVFRVRVRRAWHALRKGW